MWFADRDQVAVHTLAVAAHQIIHDIHANTFPDRPLLLNHAAIVPGYRAEFIAIFKEAANFFKHADRDPNPGSTIQFSPFLTEVFFLYSINGLQGLGESLTPQESAYLGWMVLHHTKLLSPDFLKLMSDAIPVHHLATMRTYKKCELFEAILQSHTHKSLSS